MLLPSHFELGERRMQAPRCILGPQSRRSRHLHFADFWKFAVRESAGAQV
jgi:hypothetical protein